MIRFILGEDRHVKYFVHSVKSEYFVVKDATYEPAQSLHIGNHVDDCGRGY